MDQRKPQPGIIIFSSLASFLESSKRNEIKISPGRGAGSAVKAGERERFEFGGIPRYRVRRVLVVRTCDSGL